MTTPLAVLGAAASETMWALLADAPAGAVSRGGLSGPAVRLSRWTNRTPF